MTPDQFRRIREIFESALDQPIAHRHAWLVAVCGSDTALLRQVERMLAADEAGHHLLDRSADATYEAASLVCSACGATVMASQRFCPSCGTPTAAGGPLTEGRFRAGALFAGRFRIIALQGRGGMGQVYRAQDLELGQPVALKFLTAFRSDERARNRLRKEVRLARQISHPNVCRVYDIGDASGELYLSMEYVDGEDLAGLLKRIGRLPVGKGIDIARKLCGGLAAAHARGVLHRDLKPANIMIDSHGEVRIMDFGLAAVAEQQLDAADVRSGTPAYMAPNSWRGAKRRRVATSTRWASCCTSCSPAGPPSRERTRPNCFACEKRAPRRPLRHSCPIWTRRSNARFCDVSSRTRACARRQRSMWPRRCQVATRSWKRSRPAKHPHLIWWPLPVPTRSYARQSRSHWSLSSALVSPPGSC